MDVVVTGIGLQSCLGSLTQSWASILGGKSGIAIEQPFPELSPYPLGLISNSPLQLADLTELVVTAAINDANLQFSLTVTPTERICRSLARYFTSSKRSFGS
jgi:3-oxoacyl-[acyl-carrier-protein] synthase II